MIRIKEILKDIVARILEYETRIVLWRRQPKIVAVTGNVGKTTTKDLVAATLASAYRVRKSQKSYNSEFGVPLTILNKETGWGNPLRWLTILLSGAFQIIAPTRYPDWLVLEVGADHPDDIKRITRWLHPDVAVVTCIPEIPVHLEFFASRDELVKEKAALIKALKPSGTCVLNADDETVAAFQYITSNPVLMYGQVSEAHVTSSHVSFARGADEQVAGLTFRANVSGNSVPITLSGVVGDHVVYPALAAIATGLSCGLNLHEMGAALRDAHTPVGRMQLHTGIKETMIIDDSYNASPLALERALDTLATFPGARRRISVIGDMKELGERSDDEHRRAGEHAAHVSDAVYAVGEYRETVAASARDHMDAQQVFTFTDATEAGEHLGHQMRKGDVVLIKGSQAVRLEKTVKAVMRHPENAEKLLVRQGKEWERR